MTKKKAKPKDDLAWLPETFLERVPLENRGEEYAFWVTQNALYSTAWVEARNDAERQTIQKVRAFIKGYVVDYHPLADPVTDQMIAADASVSKYHKTRNDAAKAKSSDVDLSDDPDDDSWTTKPALEESTYAGTAGQTSTAATQPRTPIGDRHSDRPARRASDRKSRARVDLDAAQSAA